MAKADWEKRIREDYCNCGAGQGLIDGDYKCSKGCLATGIITFVSQELKREREEMGKALRFKYGLSVDQAINNYLEERE